MIQFDREGALVTLRFQPPYGPEDERGYLEALGRIGDCAPGFVLLAVLGGGASLSRESERAQALWFKATRNHVNANCRAIAMVRPGANARMTATFSKLWSVPLDAFTDEQSARAFLAQHLATP